MAREVLEGSLILERLSEASLLDDFYLAVDNDDLAKVKRLLLKAGINEVSIDEVLQQIEDGT